MDINSLDFEFIISENETIDEAIAPFENAVIIVATGGCNTEKRIGYYVTLLKYKNNHKLLKGEVDNTTSSNYSVLLGILSAIENIKTSTSIVAVTNTALGFQTGWFKNKGPNKEIIRKILATVVEKKCTFKELQIITKYESLNKFIAKYYPDELKENDKQRYMSTYTEKIKTDMHKQTLEAVLEILRRYNVEQEVINEVQSVNLPSQT